MSVLQPSLALARQTEWSIDRIKDNVLKLGSGVTPSGGAAYYLDAGIPLLRSQNVHFDGLRLEDVAYISAETHREMSGTHLRSHDVLLNITGASIGRCTYVPTNFGDGNVNQHVCIIRPSAKLDFKFLTYCITAPWGQDQVFSGFTGASRQGLGQRDLGEIQVPMPPLVEQKRISAYLDDSCTAIASAIQAKQKQISTLETIRISSIQKAITKGLGNAPLELVEQDWITTKPKHWQVVHIKRLLLRMDYGISVSTEEEGAHPVLKMGHLRDGEITFEKLDFVDEVPDELLLENGDILYNRTNSPDQVGKAAIFRKSREDAVTFASYLVRLRVNHRVKPEYLNYVLNSDGFLGFARRLAIPSVQQSNLNSTRYGRMFIPLPPIDEQEAIIERLNSISRDISQTQTILSRQIDTLLDYRKSLIHECITGMRRVTNADFSETAAHA